MVKANGSTAGEQEQEQQQVPEWLDRELFVEFLERDFEDLKSIREFRVEPTGGKGENYTTLLLRANITLELNDGSLKSTSYMAKVLPNTASTRAFVATWKVFEKESNSYANYLPDFERMYREADKEVTFGPRYYQHSKQLDEDLIVLEDLGQRGFRNVKRQDGFDMVHTKAALEKLAQFHAASAVRFELKGPYPEIYNRNLCGTEDNFKELREQQTKTLVESLPLFDATHLQKTIETYSRATEDMFQAYAPQIENEFRVLNHGDAWCNNFMFQYDDEGRLSETYFVDLQMSRYCSPAQDLLYMILSSVNGDLKIQKFDYFIHYYHERLTENLTLLKYPKSLPKLKSLHQSIFLYGDWIFPVVTLLLPIVLIDASEHANMDALMDKEGSGDHFRNSLFHNSRIERHLKEILPWAHSRGAFEVVNTS
ncbi:uncharacterized protein [Drosophila pseudoobscura]|uniref:CHK kinase-like domain-containing protein n=1 Tax=Drosophila pseudoobscura pseudoobscura TaxID=46245 RepID=A0A6I8URB4_DROPS|nr:uncharacterized protein LOC4802849 [Drosophila pseudoobscura]